MQHARCADALHRARRECGGVGDAECLRRLNVHTVREDVAPVAGGVSAECVLSGHTRPFYTALSADAPPQPVTYGLPLRGNPTRVVSDASR